MTVVEFSARVDFKFYKSDFHRSRSISSISMESLSSPTSPKRKGLKSASKFALNIMNLEH
jgi:hypothetical protein